jgi:hypothetical protein
MKINLTIALVTTLALGMNILPIQQDTLNARQLNQKKKLSPPPAPKSRGVPGNRTVSASMSGTNCELNLIALAPQFSTSHSLVFHPSNPTIDEDRIFASG